MKSLGPGLGSGSQLDIALRGCVVLEAAGGCSWTEKVRKEWIGFLGCNKVLHTGELKTIGIYCLTALEAKGPKARTMLSLKALGKCPSLPCPGGSWQSLAFLACSCITPISASVLVIFPVCLQISVSYWVTNHLV